MGSRSQTDDLGAQLNQAVVLINRFVVERDAYHDVGVFRPFADGIESTINRLVIEFAFAMVARRYHYQMVSAG
jgi:hypothetical protein